MDTEYTIQTDMWSHGERMETWAPHREAWYANDKACAIRQLAYFRLAYPGYSFVLINNGYIVSTKEISDMARYLLTGGAR